MSRIEVYCFDLCEGGNVVLFGVERSALVRGGGRVGYPDRVLDQPFIDGFGWMCHEDSAFKVGFGEDVRESGCVVEMETG